MVDVDGAALALAEITNLTIVAACPSHQRRQQHQAVVLLRPIAAASRACVDMRGPARVGHGVGYQTAYGLARREILLDSVRMLAWLRRPRNWFFVLMATLLPTTIGGVLFAIHEGRQKSDQWASISSFVLAAVLAAGAALSRFWNSGRPALVTDDLVEAAVGRLAKAERQRRHAEYDLRRVDDPWPLPLRWSQTSNARSLTARWRTLRRANVPEPRLRDGTFAGIADAFLDPACPGRVVILGAPGSGKSMLALRLARDLTDRWTEGAQVPVFASLSEWNPAVDSLDSWLARRLCAENLELRTEVQSPHGGRRTLAAELLARDRILPVLDGFDEMAAARQVTALQHLNDVVGQNRRFVLTSTFESYRSSLAGARLSRTSVTEILPLDPQDVAEYLNDGSRWMRVCDDLTSGRHSPLADALTTPLTAWLVGRVYGKSHSNTEELLDATWATDRPGIERHLLGEFIRAAYAIGPRGTLVGDAHIQRVTQYLTTIATHLDHSGHREIAWWRLRNQITGLQLFNFAIWPFSAALIALRLAGIDLGSVGTGIGLGIIIGSAFAVPNWLKRKPDREVPRRLTLATVRSRNWLFRLAIAVAAMFGLGFGIPFGLRAGPLVGLVVGVAFGGMAFVIVGASVALSPAHAASPAVTLRDDRRHTLTMAFLYASMSSTGTATVVGPIGGLAAGVCGAVMIAGVGEWLPFCLFRIWSALHGLTPWRLIAFLHDANIRGVLRQSGGVYHFRHTALQQHLVAMSPANSRPSEEKTEPAPIAR